MSRTKQLWREKIIKRDGRFCKNCKAVDNLTLEHKIPECIGGEYSYENLIILCLKCNMKKYKELVKEALEYYFKSRNI